MIARSGNNYDMNIESIRELFRREPFKPFEVHMSSGDVYHVRHPEQVALGKASMVIMYRDAERDFDHMAICPFLHVANILVPEAA